MRKLEKKNQRDEIWGCVPDNEVYKGSAYDDLVEERIRVDIAQSRESRILDRIEIWILANPQGIFGEKPMVDFTSADPNAKRKQTSLWKA